jgi:hypothetical protein
MPQVHETAEGMIWVRMNDGRAYGETRGMFATDFGQEMERLEGFTERYYEPGVVHALKIGTNVVDGGPMPWPMGDSIIKAFDRIFQSKKARERKIAEEARAKMQAEVDAQWEKLPDAIKAISTRLELPPLEDE